MTEDKKEELPKEGSMTLVEHIRELRKRLLSCFVAFFICFFICFNFAGNIFNILMLPLADVMKDTGGTNRMIYTALTEGFFTHIKVSAFASLFIVFPIIANQLWCFISPALYRKEKRAFLPFLIASPILFFVGASMVYFMIIPLAWKFLLGFQTTMEQTIIPIQLEARIGDYLSLVMTLILAFGICFQLPVLLTLLVKVGIISSKNLIDKRKYAIVGVFVLAAIATPPDVVSQLGLALPLLLLYEISILASKAIEKQK